jgi:hypothetical protein
VDAERASFLAAADAQEPVEDPAEAAVRPLLDQMLARQVAEDAPPEVWQTARRLLDAGIDASDVHRQLRLALGVAHRLAAVAAERRGAVEEAESQVRAAVRDDPGWPAVEDRLAWYESDRGDAAAAARWRRLGLTAEERADLAAVERFETRPRPRSWAATSRAGAARGASTSSAT